MPDRRNRKSKTALKKALLTLLKRRTLQEIQIKQLCEKADLNRSTFYSNYHDIEELLIDIYKDAVAMIIVQKTDFGEKHTIQVLQSIQKHHDYFLVILNQPTYVYFEELLYESYLKIHNSDQKDLKAQYALRRNVIGSFSIVRRWVLDNYPISAEALAQVLCGEMG